MIKGRSDINSKFNELKRRIENIDIEIEKGSIKKAGIRFNGDVYKIWPLGFDVTFESLQIDGPARTVFDVSLDDLIIDSPPEPSNFQTALTDLIIESPPDPSNFDVTFLDLENDGRVFFETTITDTRSGSDEFTVEITDSRVVQ